MPGDGAARFELEQQHRRSLARIAAFNRDFHAIGKLGMLTNLLFDGVPYAMALSFCATMKRRTQRRTSAGTLVSLA